MSATPFFGRVALSALLLAVGCLASDAEDPELRLTLRGHTFTPSEIKAPANAAFVIIVTNQDPTPEEFESTSMKVEKIVAPNSEIKIRVRSLKAGRYEFYGEYNQDTAKGVLVVE
jgi:hypothetical protein